MRRFHLLEIAEQPWCPRVIRDGVTDYLRWAVDAGRAYDAAAPILAEMLMRTNDREIVDLCAGGGGPWRTLRTRLSEHGCDVRVRLTDRYPNHRAFAQAALESDGAVTGEIRPVDATDVPEDLQGVRTIFSAFHHFERDAAKQILRDAAARGEPIAIFEATHRSGKAIAITLLTPLLVLLSTPAIRPFSLTRLLFTYAIPIIPLVVLFDGIVSCLRTYTPDELRELCECIGAMNYVWTAGEAGKGPLPMTFLTGVRISKGLAQ